MKTKIIDAIDSLKRNKPLQLDEFLKQSINKDVVIYGAGGFGKEIASVLLNNNIKPLAFLDIKASGSLFDIPIINPNEFKNKNVVVVLAIVLNKQIRNEILAFLNNLGFMDILDAQNVRAMYVELQGEHTYEYLKANQNNILKPLDFLCDDESKITYMQNIIAHITKNYSLAYETNKQCQYFVSDIPFKKDFSRFIDCGAYIGDTFLQLLRMHSIKEYVGFEPIDSSFQKLKTTLSQHNVKSIAFPSAVSNCTGFITFDSKLGSSMASKDGDTQAMCVKLDDVLHNFDPTFLKMDIEGEEINALNGAKNLICKSKPELAICVYHYINHFWEIPNILNDWNLGYKFYLRTHSSACMETVLYAVLDK